MSIYFERDSLEAGLALNDITTTEIILVKIYHTLGQSSQVLSLFLCLPASISVSASLHRHHYLSLSVFLSIETYTLIKTKKIFQV